MLADSAASPSALHCSDSREWRLRIKVHGATIRLSPISRVAATFYQISHDRCPQEPTVYVGDRKSLSIGLLFQAPRITRSGVIPRPVSRVRERTPGRARDKERPRSNSGMAATLRSPTRQMRTIANDLSGRTRRQMSRCHSETEPWPRFQRSASAVSLCPTIAWHEPAARLSRWC